MSMQTWGETLVSAQVDGTALTNSTTATSILPAAAKFTLPANYFAIGRVLRINAWGRISNVVTTPGTLTLDVRFGSTVVFNGGAMQLNTTAKTNVSWRAIIMLTCRSIGSGTSATLFGQGDWCSESATGSAAGVANDILMPASAPAVGTGFDSTASQAIDLFATFSVASASNSIQLHQYTVEAMN
jgi:hypothetical protein